MALDTPVGARCLPPPPAGLRQNPPGQVQAPEKHHQLHCQVGHEEWVVALPHAVLHPGAVVVVAAHTATALTAVPGPQGLQQQAVSAAPKGDDLRNHGCLLLLGLFLGLGLDVHVTRVHE